MRLIDADALEKQGLKFETHGGATFITLGSVRCAPTIEAEPVKHGEWVWDSDNDRYVCSRCNKEPSGDCNGGCVSHLSDYCPNCGAKMDKENDDEILQ